MTEAVTMDMRRKLLSAPPLADFVALHPDWQAPPAAARDAAGLCAALAATPAAPSAALALQLAWLRRENGCPATPPTVPAPESVLLEFGVESGVDALVAWSDGAFGWYDSRLRRLREGRLAPGDDALLRSLLQAVAAAGAQFGAGQHRLPPGPAAGEIVISRITVDGIAFGKGPMRAIAGDKYGGPIIHWGLQLADLLKP